MGRGDNCNFPRRLPRRCEMIRRVGPPKPPSHFEVVTDPDEIEQIRQQHEQAKLNIDWLHTHWHEVLPQAFGKYVAVAGQTAFIGDDPVETRARAVAAHPDDVGVYLHYVPADFSASGEMKCFSSPTPQGMT